MKVGVGGTHKLIPTAKVGVGGAWKTVSNAWAGVGGVWKQIYTAFAVDYQASIVGSGSGFATSGPADTGGASWTSPAYTGGSGSYSYSWAYVSGDATIGITSATQERPLWSHSSVTTSRQAVWRVTVTDTANGNTATDDITVVLTWSDLT